MSARVNELCTKLMLGISDPDQIDFKSSILYLCLRGEMSCIRVGHKVDVGKTKSQEAGKST